MFRRTRGTLLWRTAFSLTYSTQRPGISRDSWHKRRATGGKRKPLRKKRKFELGRPPASTKVMASTVRVLLLELCTLDTGVRSSVLSGFTVFGREEETPSTGHCDWTRGTSPGAQKVIVRVSVNWFGLRVLAAPKCISSWSPAQQPLVWVC